jgi:transposase
MRRYELREDQWLKIAPLLPGKATDPGRSGQDNRQFVQALLWIARSGAPWRDLPERYSNSIGIRFFSALTGGVKKGSGKKYLKPYKSLTWIGCWWIVPLYVLINMQPDKKVQTNR